MRSLKARTLEWYVFHTINVRKNPVLSQYHPQITLFARTGIQEPDFDLVMDSTLSTYYTPRPIPSTPTQYDVLSSPPVPPATTATTMAAVTSGDGNNSSSNSRDSGEEEETTVTEYAVTHGGLD